MASLLKQTTPDLGVAFVLVPHLDPSHESLLVDLLSKQTVLPVVEATDRVEIQANHVYIIAPNTWLTIARGQLRLTKPPQEPELYGVLDIFLRSLAEEQGEKAIGVVLSGTGRYGLQGMEAIKAVGGLVIAQRPTTAAFPSMPQAAIDAGIADLVLAPAEIPEALSRYIKNDFLTTAEPSTINALAQSQQFQRILSLLKAHTKHDFRGYRKKMLVRRVERRMGLNHLNDVARYIELLRENPDETKRLSHDLLIGVTEFFRDPEAFEVLAQQVVPELLHNIPEDTPARVWVPGCSTGEEAYSVAIVLMENMSQVGRSLNLQVFATDVDEKALGKARRGIYSAPSMRNVSPERKQRYFSSVGEGSYQVSKPLRDSIVFAPQNLINDAPFSKLDLVTCRNLLIYLEPETQQRILSVFHFALKPRGYLLLGPSETIGRQNELFETISSKWRVFRRTETSSRRLKELPAPKSPGETSQFQPSMDTNRTKLADVERLTEQLLLRGAPAAVLINRRHEIVNYRGPTRDYLEHPDGPPQHDLMKLAMEGLRHKLREAIAMADREQVKVLVDDARVKRDGKYWPVKFTVEPVIEEPSRGLMLITFEERDGNDSRVRRSGSLPSTLLTSEGTSGDSTVLVQQLEQELKHTRADLQNTIEEQESANEELKAANEEVMSMNEELQSTNEELESSKEELQSVNEELATVNNQLEKKVTELVSANSMVTNLLRSTEYATVFLDRDFQIRLFTAAAQKLFSLRHADIGRPIAEISPRIKDAKLLDDCRRVLENLTNLEREVWEHEHSSQDSASPTPSRCYLRRVLPFRTLEDRIDGVVITLIDITDRKHAEQVTEEARKYAEAIIATVREPLIVLDAALTVQTANTAYYQAFQTSAEETVKRSFFELGNRQWNLPDLRSFLSNILGQEAAVTELRVEQTFAQLGARVLMLSASRIRRNELHPDEILLAIEDITEREQAELALRQLHLRLEKRVAEQMSEISLLAEAISHLGEGVLITDAGLDLPGPRIRFVNEAMCRISGYSAEELMGQSPRILQGEETSAATRAQIRSELSANRSCSVEIVNYRKDKTKYQAELFITPLFDATGVRTNFVSIHRDVTKRKQAEHAIKEREERLRAILNTASDSIITIDHQGIIEDANRATELMFGYTRNELVGHHIRMLMPHPYSDEHDRYIANYLESKTPRIIGVGRELVALRKDGSIFPVGLAVSEVDHLGLFTGVIRDISERTRLQRDVLAIAEEEQRRIGQDLHDSTQQELAGLSMLAQTLSDNLTRDAQDESHSGAAKHSLLAQRIVDGIARTHAQLQTISRGLIPVQLERDGLMNALREIAARTDGLNGVSCAFKCEAPLNVGDSITSTHLYRICQEAVANALKHGRPHHILIALESENGYPILQIADDGVGIDPNGKFQGMGLKSMHYRASLIGANLSIQPVETGGTLVTCKVLSSGGASR